MDGRRSDAWRHASCMAAALPSHLRDRLIDRLAPLGPVGPATGGAYGPGSGSSSSGGGAGGNTSGMPHSASTSSLGQGGGGGGVGGVGGPRGTPNRGGPTGGNILYLTPRDLIRSLLGCAVTGPSVAGASAGLGLQLGAILALGHIHSEHYEVRAATAR